MSTSSRSAIFSRHATSGCDVLVHHLLTVDGVTPNCPANQREVRFFSNKTIFMRLISSILIVLFHKDSDLFSIYIQNREINMKLGYILGIFMYLLSKKGQMLVVLNSILLSSTNILCFFLDSSIPPLTIPKHNRSSLKPLPMVPAASLQGHCTLYACPLLLPCYSLATPFLQMRLEFYKCSNWSALTLFRHHTCRRVHRSLPHGSRQIHRRHASCHYYGWP